VYRHTLLSRSKWRGIAPVPSARVQNDAFRGRQNAQSVFPQLAFGITFVLLILSEKAWFSCFAYTLLAPLS
jgi:hypothetical protein